MYMVKEIVKIRLLRIIVNKYGNRQNDKQQLLKI